MTKTFLCRAFAFALTGLLVSALKLFSQSAEFAPAQKDSKYIYNEILSLDDSRVKALEAFAKARGIVNALPVRPWSVAQVLDFLDDLESGGTFDRLFASAASWNTGLSAKDKQFIQTLRDSFRRPALLSEENFQFKLQAALHPEVYLKTRDTSELEGGYWEYDYNDRLPLFELDSQLAWGPESTQDSAFYSVWGDINLDLREDHNVVTMDLAGSGMAANSSNFPEDFTYVDFQFPHRALLSAGGSFWLFTLGRDQLNLGNGAYGNLGVSDSPDYYDAARLQLRADNFTYTGLWISLEPDLSGLEELEPASSSGEADYEDAKNLFVHRLDFNMFNSVHLGLMEGILVGGVQPSLKYFNPFIIFHDLYPWKDGDFTSASSYFGVELTMVPVRGLNLWGQFGMNQYQTELELSEYEEANVIPNAWGALAGLSYDLVLDSSGEADENEAFSSVWILEFGLEGAYTNPWFYIRENGLNSWFWRRRLVSNVSGGSQFYEAPIGWYLGPDSESLGLWLELSRYNAARFRLNFEYRLQGENTILSEYEESTEAVELETPSGIPMETYIAGFSGEVLLFNKYTFNLDWVPETKFHWDLCYIYRINAAHVEGQEWQDFQVVLGFDFAW